MDEKILTNFHITNILVQQSGMLVSFVIENLSYEKFDLADGSKATQSRGNVFIPLFKHVLDFFWSLTK